MPSDDNGSEDASERLRRLQLLASALFRDSERLRSELKVVLAAQGRFSEDIQQAWLDVEELRGKLDGQIGFTDLVAMKLARG